MKHIASKLSVVLMVITVIGFAAYAFAGGGMGYGRYHGERGYHDEWGHHGYGMHHGGYGCPGSGYMKGDLGDEEIQKMDEQREAFFKSTEDLRQKIYEKRLALESEFAKKSPDAKNATNLQKEISDLRAQIDQKRIDHMLEMKKVNPNLGRGHRGSGRMGYGSSYGRPCGR